MASDLRRLSSVRDVEAMCRKPVPAEKIEQLRNRPEQNPVEKCRENHAVSEELKKQIIELSQIRKSETVEARIEKMETAIATLGAQTKPLKRALNSALYSTDTQLLELVAQTARETLFEIGSNSTIDPVDVGKKIAVSLKQAHNDIQNYKPDKSQWCSEWIVEEDMDRSNELYSDFFKDSNLPLSHRFGFRFGLFHRYNREFQLFSKPATSQSDSDDKEKYIAPAVYPFNVDSDFM
ncbi:hypothetical protein CAEBREN_31094 [Caenorhabditis brenneri]|uniref:Uncharacterized protein n=1 Tax=Caenorhabditis brenneri TaxID=135651 RepID=G0PEV9_CAEBE|nr:hypothetical protein CAEBREN_31094 [Caenorhabditis brenneri]